MRLRQKQSVFSHFVFSRDNVCLRRCLRAAAAEGRSRLQHEYDSITEMQVENYYL